MKKVQLSNDLPAGRQEKLILLDLDRTLFDSASFRQKSVERVSRFLGKAQDVQGIVDSVVSELGFFDPDRFSERICETVDAKDKEEIVRKLMSDPEDMKTYFYRDVAVTIKKLRSIGRVGIYSQGNKEYQQAKLTGIKQLLDLEHIHVLGDKKLGMEKVFRGYRQYKLYFIDDMLVMLQEAKRVRPDAIAVWMKRARYLETQEPILGFTPDAVAYDMKQVIDIVKRR